MAGMLGRSGVRTRAWIVALQQESLPCIRQDLSCNHGKQICGVVPIQSSRLPATRKIVSQMFCLYFSLRSLSVCRYICIGVLLLDGSDSDSGLGFDLKMGRELRNEVCPLSRFTVESGLAQQWRALQPLRAVVLVFWLKCAHQGFPDEMDQENASSKPSVRSARIVQNCRNLVSLCIIFFSPQWKASHHQFCWILLGIVSGARRAEGQVFKLHITAQIPCPLCG